MKYILVSVYLYLATIDDSMYVNEMLYVDDKQMMW